MEKGMSFAVGMLLGALLGIASMAYKHRLEGARLEVPVPVPEACRDHVERHKYSTVTSPRADQVAEVVADGDSVTVTCRCPREKP